MARENVPVLDSGDLFPGLAFDIVGGEKIKLPDAILGTWSVVLFYRGDWCRQDRQQLLDYQIRTQLFAALDIRVVAASAESLESATMTVKDLRLTYPVGYGLDAKEVSRLVGAYYDDTQHPPIYRQPVFCCSHQVKYLTQYTARAQSAGSPHWKRHRW